MSMRLPDHCSIFQAKVWTIQTAVKIIKFKNVHRRKIITLADSKVAIKALDSSILNFSIQLNFGIQLSQVSH